MKKYLALFVLIVLIVPSIVSASWWNPKTWFNNWNFNKQDIVDVKTIEPVINNEEQISPKIIPSVTVNKDTKKSKESLVIENKTETTKPIVVTPITTPESKSINTEIKISNKNPEADIEEVLPVEDPEYVITLKKFTKNSPYIEDFRSLCKTAKNINTDSKRQVLSENRKDIEMVPVTLYEAMKCSILENKDFTDINTYNGLFEWELDYKDTDVIRIQKIKYNEKIKLMNLTDYQFLIYNSKVIVINKDKGNILKNMNYVHYGDYVYIPEKIALNLIKNYNKQK